jgi:hypothetical protein
MPDLSIRIAKPYVGPRHARLYAIWETIAEYWQDHLTVGFSPNVGSRHSIGEMYSRMWREELEQPSRFVLLTQHSFLPSLLEPWWYTNPGPVLESLDAEHSQEFAGLAVEDCWREPKLKSIRFLTRPGSWWVLLDKERFNDDIDFRGNPRSCNQLDDGIGGVYLAHGVDAYPRHWGIEYQFGEYLPFARFLHSSPEHTVEGHSLREIQAAHDLAVQDFLKDAPDAFRDLFQSRHASLQ